MARVPQAGAVVFRATDGRPEILIVRAKEEPHWIFPKGHLEKTDADLAAAAEREAREEAGAVGRTVRPLCPPLKFLSKGEKVNVQYYLVAMTKEIAPSEKREKQWLAPTDARATLTHEDARRLLDAALPDIRDEVALAAWSAFERRSGAPPDADAFRDLLLHEYEHIGDSLLRNEEDGEKRVTFFITLVGAVMTALAFLLGHDDQALRALPARAEPLLIFSLLALVAFGYLTIARIVHRNLASDRYKRGLNRVRRYFVREPDDLRVALLPFNPFRLDPRPSIVWHSIGRGGWLETVTLVEALVAGLLVAAIIPTPSWWSDGLVAFAAAIVAWSLLIRDIRRRYALRPRPC